MGLQAAYPTCTIHICVLVLGILACIPETEWREQLAPLSLSAQAVAQLFNAAAEVALIALYTTWLTRNAALRARPTAALYIARNSSCYLVFSR